MTILSFLSDFGIVFLSEPITREQLTNILKDFLLPSRKIITDKMEVDSPVSQSLQNEWNSIEKNNSGSLTGSSDDVKAGSTVAQDQDEEDESHLPPGVRKKNRCHSSSSSSSNSDSEDEGKSKNHKDAKDHSDNSDSDSSGDERKTDTKDEKKKEELDSSEKKKVIPPSTKESWPVIGPKKAESFGAQPTLQWQTQRSEHFQPPVMKLNQEKKNRRRSSSASKRRSRDRDHHRRKRRDRSRDRKHSRSRSRERRRSRSHERKRSSRSRSRDRRRSRSRDKRRSRSHERRDRHRGSGRDRGSRRSRDRRSNSRSRSRSRSPKGGKVIKYGDKVIKAGASFGRPPSSKPMTFKEKMRQQLIKAMEEGGDASQALTDKDGTVICRQTAGTMQVPQPQVPPPPTKPPVPLMANLVTSTASLQAATVSAAEAAMQSMLALQKETEEKTGVEIPKYYNPAAINPVKYAEQVQKRKLLWSKTKDKDVNSQWNATGLSSDHDDKSKEKFRKLMGIKGEGSTGPEEETAEEHEKEIKQKELFDKLDKEYQFARMATHTHRGIGLGFGSVANYEPPPSSSS
ncbi:arginine/serine-rich coiled-coil protein 2 [Elysia marginata]|uniref:Arginine/serine-rich coiled-coil protein 2 n=1 Tax=Elysia marginata TaxID=1093978 RepID=A0AAV4F8Q5_9GAST|nr:arginine/serine-rich coiled-coil protein 2 [Elysia marginata]